MARKAGLKGCKVVFAVIVPFTTCALNAMQLNIQLALLTLTDQHHIAGLHNSFAALTRQRVLQAAASLGDTATAESGSDDWLLLPI